MGDPFACAGGGRGHGDDGRTLQGTASQQSGRLAKRQSWLTASRLTTVVAISIGFVRSLRITWSSLRSALRRCPLPLGKRHGSSGMVTGTTALILHPSVPPWVPSHQTLSGAATQSLLVDSTVVF